MNVAKIIIKMLIHILKRNKFIKNFMITYLKVFKRSYKILALSKTKGFQITYIYKKKKL